MRPSLTFHVLWSSCGVLLVSLGGSAVAALRLRSVARPIPHGLHVGLTILLWGSRLSISLGAVGRSWSRGGGEDWQ